MGLTCGKLLTVSTTGGGGVTSPDGGAGGGFNPARAGGGQSRSEGILPYPSGPKSEEAHPHHLPQRSQQRGGLPSPSLPHSSSSGSS